MTLSIIDCISVENLTDKWYILYYRGSYPPLSPKYSYDLRGLIAKLFKRTPR